MLYAVAEVRCWVMPIVYVMNGCTCGYFGMWRWLNLPNMKSSGQMGGPRHGRFVGVEFAATAVDSIVRWS